MTTKYRNPKILARTKGQRYDKPAFGGSIAMLDNCGNGVRGIPANCKIEQVGEGLGYQGHGIEKKPVFYFEVTKPNGDIVPCYSFTAGLDPNGYMICQNFSYKIAKA